MKRYLCICCVIGISIAFQSCQKEAAPLRVWEQQPVPVEMDINSIWFSDDQNGFAVGGISWQSGCLLSTTNGGKAWQIDSLTGFTFDAVMADSSGRAYAVGQAGKGYERPPGKTAWYLFREDYRWHRACFMRHAAQAVIVSGESFGEGEIRTFGPEYFWSLDTLQPFPNQLQAVWSTSEKNWHACGLGWVLRSSDGGYTWERKRNTGDFYTAIHFPTPQTGYICGRSGSILKTADEGVTWREIRKGGAVKPRLQVFRSIWFSDEQEGWVVGESGLFWHTANGGDTWEQVGGIPENTQFTDVFVRNGKGWAAAEGGKIFYFEK